MTDFGKVLSSNAVELVADHEDDEATGLTTVSATLEDITGLSVTVSLPAAGRISAIMVVQCSTTGGSPATGAWAISINSVDGTEIQRYLSGTNDTGALSVIFSAALAAGDYTVQGRHRRVSGASTVNTDVAQLQAEGYID